jgi:hypothetical protein
MKFRTRTAELLTELAPVAADPSVPARQKHVFGYWLLDHALPDSTLAKTGIYRSPPAMDVASARTAQETLISALQGFDVESDAEAAASAILQRCALKGDAVRFCLDLIEQTAKARPNSLWANLDAAFNLATWSKSRAAESRVLALLTTAKANRDQAKQGKQRRLDAWFDATELYAGAWRIEDQSDAELAAVDRRWESLSRFPVGANGPDAASAWGQRVNLAIFRDERDKLRMLVDEGRTRRRDHSTTFINEFLFQLSEGKPNDAVSSLRRVLLDAKRSKESMVVMAVAIARLLQGEKFAPEIISNAIADDNYPIHVRLLLATAARLEGDPDWRKPLDETWQGVQKATWPNRLKAMDPLAWAEVLLGEYLGDSTAQELMRSVDEDAAFASSPLAGLEVPVGELRCERFFYQAIRTWAEGGENGRQEALALFGRVLATRKTSFFEHAMASFLIKKLTN